MKVAVIGAGLRGMAVAARLAKQGHQVTVYEQRAEVGGALRRVTAGGFGWDRGPASVPLPAPLRDLFRKSGRPLERYVDLQLSVPARRHRFADASVLDLPTGSRADQLHAIDDALGPGLGSAWSQFVDRQADVWNTLRLGMFVEPDTVGRLTDWETARGLTPHLSLARVMRRALADPRLRAMVMSGVLAGQEPRGLPAFAAAAAYVERTFGVWAPATGLAELAAALETRLTERSVEVRCGAAVSAITTTGGAADGVELADGERERADLVIAAVDPFQVFATLLNHPTSARTRKLFGPAARLTPSLVTYLGLRGAEPRLPREVVLHGDPTLVLHTSGIAPAGHRAWSVEHRAGSQRDVLELLAERGVEVRDQVVTRLDGDATHQSNEPGRMGALAWAGFRVHRRRVAAASPLSGLHVLGAAPTPLDSVPYAVWEASGLAVAIGKV